MDKLRSALQQAKLFHETYERLAPQFGYETRLETREFDPDSPNGKLMIAVCEALASPSQAEMGRALEKAEQLIKELADVLDEAYNDTHDGLKNENELPSWIVPAAIVLAKCDPLYSVAGQHAKTRAQPERDRHPMCADGGCAIAEYKGYQPCQGDCQYVDATKNQPEMVMVPREPTEEMLEAAQRMVVDEGYICNMDGYSAIYHAMLAGAPSQAEISSPTVLEKLESIRNTKSGKCGLCGLGPFERCVPPKDFRECSEFQQCESASRYRAMIAAPQEAGRCDCPPVALTQAGELLHKDEFCPHQEEAGRDAVLEEAAKVCDRKKNIFTSFGERQALESAADAIRSLKTQGEKR